MTDIPKVRRGNIVEGIWCANTKGTEVLIKHELWERVVKEISSPTTLETRKLLAEIGGEDD